MPSTAQQRVLIGEYMMVTAATERQAFRMLQKHGFRMDLALDAHYMSLDPSTRTIQSITLDQQLSKAFDVLKRDPKQDGKDEIGVESTMTYLGSDLGVNLENAELFVAMEVLQAPSVGAITRNDYIRAWKSHVLPNSAHHAEFVRRKIAVLSTDPTYFKQVYRHAFVAGKEAGQKSLDLDTAFVYWDMLFAPPGIRWASISFDWLTLWKKYLRETWTRSVNRDMWNQTLEFAYKTIEADGLTFWSEEAAWPSVIDDFVGWCRQNGVGVPPAAPQPKEEMIQ